MVRLPRRPEERGPDQRDKGARKREALRCRQPQQRWRNGWRRMRFTAVMVMGHVVPAANSGRLVRPMVLQYNSLPHWHQRGARQERRASEMTGQKAGAMRGRSRYRAWRPPDGTFAMTCGADVFNTAVWPASRRLSQRPSATILIPTASWRLLPVLGALRFRSGTAPVAAGSGAEFAPAPEVAMH